MNQEEFNRIIEEAQRRELQQSELQRIEAFLLLHPECRPLWDEERQLNQALRQLPPVTLSSNFTAQVMSAIQQPVRTTQAGSFWFRIPRLLAQWLPHLATASLMLLLGGMVLYQQRLTARQQTAEKIQVFAQMPELADTEALAHFDAINQLGETTVYVDEELLAALQPTP